MLHRVSLRITAPLSLSAALLAGPALLSAAPAQADEVNRAVVSVHHARAAAEAATRQLLVGTRQWEADRTVLAGLQRRLAAASALVTAEEVEAAAGKARVAVVARRLYMTPGLDAVGVALGMNADDAIAMLRTRGELEHVAGTDTEIIRRARIAQLRLEAKKRDVAALAGEAGQVAKRSELHLRDLQALAERTAHQLNLAEGALARARGRQAARMAAARAARYRIASGGAGCTLRSTAGMSNGQLDPSVLCTLWHAPGQRLRTDAARAFSAMSQYHSRWQRTPLCVTDSYRSYSAQVDVYRRKPGLAAVPGTSKHGWGLAADLCGGVQTFGSPAYRWMKANAGRFGFHHPSWAEPSGSMPEAWHWEYRG
ncbi:MAG TPA: M15 family metallopeptidase [Nonomuraea sp.]|nr:M15 family metallopeptidase [Nonomuraea sp.]